MGGSLICNTSRLRAVNSRYIDLVRVHFAAVARVEIMETSLQSLFQAIAQAQAESELRQPVMAQVGEYFTATRWGLSFLDEFPSIDANTPVSTVYSYRLLDFSKVQLNRVPFRRYFR
jgi:hypothetical protein